MERKCSECGKICGDNAHFNMKGEFADWILCGFCYDIYEEKLLLKYKEDWQKGFDVYKSRKGSDMEFIKEFYAGKSRKRYEDLTGKKPIVFVQ